MVHSPSAQAGLRSITVLHFFADSFFSDRSGSPGEIANNFSVLVSNGVRAMVTAVSGLFHVHYG